MCLQTVIGLVTKHGQLSRESTALPNDQRATASTQTEQSLALIDRSLIVTRPGSCFMDGSGNIQLKRLSVSTS